MKLSQKITGARNFLRHGVYNHTCYSQNCTRGAFGFNDSKSK